MKVYAVSQEGAEMLASWEDELDEEEDMTKDVVQEARTTDMRPYLSAKSWSLQEWQAEVREVNELNGWFDKDRPFSADIALLHSEVSEAYEGFRNDDPENVDEELADVFIRLMDTVERRGTDLAEEVRKKLRKNRERGYRHGGKAE